MKWMINVAFPFIFLFTVPVPGRTQDTAQCITANRVNDNHQQEKPYVILVSADGFRYDYAEKYNAENLLRLSGGGVRADYLMTSYPSLTFPNHYTLVTGLYPSHHGIVDNSFYDRQRNEGYGMHNRNKVKDGTWYGGVPLWVLAEKQQMLTASYYWVASESNIHGASPTYYYKYNEKTAIENRVQAVVNWLQMPPATRPHFISFYFPEVDHAGHTFGPDAAETGAAVRFVDSAIGKLVSEIDKLGLDVNYLFVADHGMTTVDNKNPLWLPPAMDTSKFIISDGSALLQLYAKEKKDIEPAYRLLQQAAKDYSVYLPDETPVGWHYTKKDDRFNRIGDMLLVPHKGKIFSMPGKKVNYGKHGFDPAFIDMFASFYAWGPAFKKHHQIPGFENIHVFPLIAHLLGLTYTEPVDGRLEVLKPILK